MKRKVNCYCTPEFIHEAKRMYEYNKEHGVECEPLQINYEAVRKVQQWSDEHPEVRRIDVLQELLEKAGLSEGFDFKKNFTTDNIAGMLPVVARYTDWWNEEYKFSAEAKDNLNG